MRIHQLENVDKALTFLKQKQVSRLIFFFGKAGSTPKFSLLLECVMFDVKICFPLLRI